MRLTQGWLNRPGDVDLYFHQAPHSVSSFVVWLVGWLLGRLVGSPSFCRVPGS